MKNYLTLVFYFVFIQFGFGQLFTKVVPQNPIGLYYSHSSWFDFDNDGDLDFLINGAVSTNDLRTLLYENTGNDNFRQALAPFNLLPQYSESPIAFLNTNQDDRIDVIMMGRKFGGQNDRISVLENRTTGFQNLGPLPDFGFADGYGTLSVGDVNRDGVVDIFASGITGFDTGNPTVAAYIYLGKGNSFVKKASTPFTGMYLADSKLADLDNDQDLDLIVSGSRTTFPYQLTEVYLNDGLGNFSFLSTGMANLQNSSIELADYDNDGDLDILFSGLDASLASKTKLYRNNLGSFTEVSLTSALDRTASGSAKWGDFDNDGDLDILMTGQDQPNHIKLAVFKNNGADQFEEISDTSFEALGIGYASWGDYDSDGDLDILATGAFPIGTDVQGVVYILKNGTTIKNNAPAKPANLTVNMINDSTCTIAWDPSADDLTSSSSLTYNLCVKKGSQFLLSPMSDDLTGKRKITEPGNVWLNRNWKITSLDDNGIYSFKVQAIDGGLSASGWSNEKFIYLGVPLPPSDLGLAFANGKVRLSWADHSNNEEYFVIERKVNAGTFQKLDSVTTNVVTYDDPYVAFNVNEYRVYAVNPNQKSAFSNSVQTTIDAPTDLGFTLTGQGITLNWTDNSYNEQSFVIETKDDGGNYAKIDSVSSNNVSYTQPMPGEGSYEYRIYAENPRQKSGYSNSIQVVITGVEPDSRTGLFFYPNPVADVIIIKSANFGANTVNVEILNCSGIIMMSESLRLDSEGEARLPLASMPPGFYLMKLITPEKKVRMVKLVKLQ